VYITEIPLQGGEMTTDILLETKHLKKQFGSVNAVQDVSLSVKHGEIFGFVGPNGAGKTTTISMILGLIYPTSGEVKVLGQRITPTHNSALRRVGVMVGAPTLLIAFSARQNLQCLARIYPDIPTQRIDEVLTLVGLQHTGKRAVSKFSTGMKQRLGLALAIFNKPDLLILDEPTNGMDPAGMHEVRTLLRTLADQGTTIFFSSHLLHEVELLCNRVAVVQHGRVIAQGAVSDLLKTQEVIRVHVANPAQAAHALQSLSNIGTISIQPTYLDVQGVPSDRILSYLVSQGIVPTEVSILHPDLESVFLELTQKLSESRQEVVTQTV
jgi:ABC-2 type transport system ATP-binding protein